MTVTAARTTTGITEAVGGYAYLLSRVCTRDFKIYREQSRYTTNNNQVSLLFTWCIYLYIFIIRIRNLIPQLVEALIDLFIKCISSFLCMFSNILIAKASDNYSTH